MMGSVSVGVAMDSAETPSEKRPHLKRVCAPNLVMTRCADCKITILVSMP